MNNRRNGPRREADRMEPLTKTEFGEWEGTQFAAHAQLDADQSRDIEAIRAALFRQADPAAGTPPGLVQQVAAIHANLEVLMALERKRRNYAVGFLAGVSCLWIVLTEWGAKFVTMIRGH